jgi:hypothetical protein
MKKHLQKILTTAVVFLVPYLLSAQPVARDMVVMEIATGCWCYYCPGAAMGAEDLLINGCKVAVCENHNGDPFANQYSNARNTYWGITGFPTAIFDGVTGVVGGNHSTSMYSSYLPKYTQRINTPANIDMVADITNSGLDYTALITITKVGTVTPTDLLLHFFVTISNIQYNWQGQTHVEHVTALMVPDQNGTSISFAGGDVQTVTLNFSLDASWDVADVEFVTFVQSQGVMEVYNGIKRAAIDLTPGFTASATTVNEDESVTFTNETFGGYIGVPESYHWIFPGGTPATSTDKDPVVVYSTAGTYDVTLIVDRGSQIDTLVKPSYITVSGPAGIDPAAARDFTIYPNPCNGNFVVTARELYDLKIVDLTGNVVYMRNGNAGNGNFVTGLKPGIYFVMIQSGSKSHSEKIVVR